MAKRLVPAPTVKRIWPAYDPTRTCGVVTILFLNGLGVIHTMDDTDVIFFAGDVLGGSDIKQGQSVTFRVEHDQAVLICNIHSPVSEQALLDVQTQPIYAYA